MLIEGHPELRARRLPVAGTRWTETLTPAVARRPAARRSLRAALVVGAALACFDATRAEVTRRVNGQSAIDCWPSRAHTQRRA
jgi:hypothetical protein